MKSAMNVKWELSQPLAARKVSGYKGNCSPAE